MKIYLICIGVCWAIVCFAAGYLYGRPKANSIPVSQAALFEINMACSGDYKDLAVNRHYVYANCRSGKPVTVQNYLFK